ncbi:hypothetical protein [Phaffia rhodozyma]|uniref:Uncharacterized protein n=1 Tax=Phaffia rhodozyma TaxID=264483 RepID=A0A0F7SKQ9_PHARH|nr:hypothetical protein [Phaffia rhodozyma]
MLPQNEPYQHPSLTSVARLQLASQSSKTLAIDHMLSLQLQARSAQLQTELGLSTLSSSLPVNPKRKQLLGTPEVLGYGVSGRKLSDSKKVHKAAFGSSLSGQGPILNEASLSQLHALKVKAEGIERLLSTMLAKYKSSRSYEDESEDESDWDEDSYSPPPQDVQPLPEAIRIRLSLSELLDVLSQNSNGPSEPLSSGKQSTHAVTPSQEYAIDLLYNISSPLLSSASSFCRTNSQKTGFRPDFSVTNPAYINPAAFVSAETASAIASSSSRTHVYPPGSIWDQVPRAAGPEGPWAFAGSQPSSSSSTSTSSAHAPDLPSTVGPKAKKAVGRSKALYQDGVSRDPSWGSIPSVRLSTLALESSFPTLVDRPVSSGLAPAERKWFQLEESTDLGRALASGKLLYLLKQFILVSAALSKSIGQTAVEQKVHLMRNRLARARTIQNDWLESDSEGSVVEEASSSYSSSCESDDERQGGRPTRRLSSLTAGSSSRSGTHRASLSSSTNPFHQTKAPSFRLPPSIPPSRQISRESSPVRASRAGAARPSRTWYALLASLLTQVCLEGFLHHGWLGGEGVDLVLGVGSGGVTGKGAGLAEAAWILFGGRNPGSGGKRREEFEREMDERRSEFLTIDNQTPSLLDHLHGLQARYPFDRFERAFLEFIEDASYHLGVPELANLRPIRPSAPPTPRSAANPGNIMSLASLLNPHPNHVPPRFPTYQAQPPTPPLHPSRAPPRTGVQKYFVPPRLKTDNLTSMVGTKRRDRSVPGTRSYRDEGAHKPNRGEDGEGNTVVIAEDYPDPYGV